MTHTGGEVFVKRPSKGIRLAEVSAAVAQDKLALTVTQPLQPMAASGDWVRTIRANKPMEAWLWLLSIGAERTAESRGLYAPWVVEVIGGQAGYIARGGQDGGGEQFITAHVQGVAERSAIHMVRAVEVSNGKTVVTASYQGVVVEPACGWVAGRK